MLRVRPLTTAYRIVKTEIIHRTAVARFGHFCRAIVRFAVEGRKLARHPIPQGGAAPTANFRLDDGMRAAGIRVDAAKQSDGLFLARRPGTHQNGLGMEVTG